MPEPGRTAATQTIGGPLHASFGVFANTASQADSREFTLSAAVQDDRYLAPRPSSSMSTQAAAESTEQEMQTDDRYHAPQPTCPISTQAEPATQEQQMQTDALSQGQSAATQDDRYYAPQPSCSISTQADPATQVQQMQTEALSQGQSRETQDDRYFAPQPTCSISMQTEVPKILTASVGLQTTTSTIQRSDSGIQTVEFGVTKHSVAVQWEQQAIDAPLDSGVQASAQLIDSSTQSSVRSTVSSGSQTDELPAVVVYAQDAQSETDASPKLVSGLTQTEAPFARDAGSETDAPPRLISGLTQTDQGPILQDAGSETDAPPKYVSDLSQTDFVSAIVGRDAAIQAVAVSAFTTTEVQTDLDLTKMASIPVTDFETPMGTSLHLAVAEAMRSLTPTTEPQSALDTKEVLEITDFQINELFKTMGILEFDNVLGILHIVYSCVIPMMTNLPPAHLAYASGTYKCFARASVEDAT
ncbi:hypothetical protein DFJ77DRAFT_99121 [Powellomyces hirtus]|nr:hypothetical protein DFJ77DRAFT_99121 [Powellomyces hirtus]